MPPLYLSGQISTFPMLERDRSFCPTDLKRSVKTAIYLAVLVTVTKIYSRRMEKNHDINKSTSTCVFYHLILVVKFNQLIRQNNIIGLKNIYFAYYFTHYNSSFRYIKCASVRVYVWVCMWVWVSVRV